MLAASSAPLHYDSGCTHARKKQDMDESAIERALPATRTRLGAEQGPGQPLPRRHPHRACPGQPPGRYQRQIENADVPWVSAISPFTATTSAPSRPARAEGSEIGFDTEDTNVIWWTKCCTPAAPSRRFDAHLAIGRRAAFADVSTPRHRELPSGQLRGQERSPCRRNHQVSFAETDARTPSRS
jgi:hypothetical protein